MGTCQKVLIPLSSYLPIWFEWSRKIIYSTKCQRRSSGFRSLNFMNQNIFPKNSFNDTYMEELLCFTEFSIKNAMNLRLAVSDVFHMFTQSITFF